MLQIIEYRSGKRQKREYRKLVAVEKGETLPGDVTVWQDYLHIPPVPPTGLFRCKVLDISYELHVSARILSTIMFLSNKFAILQGTMGHGKIVEVPCSFIVLEYLVCVGYLYIVYYGIFETVNTVNNFQYC